jgi:hypothetical protein
MKILKLLKHRAVRPSTKPSTNRLPDSSLLLIAMLGSIGHYLYSSTGQFVSLSKKSAETKSLSM